MPQQAARSLLQRERLRLLDQFLRLGALAWLGGIVVAGLTQWALGLAWFALPWALTSLLAVACGVFALQRLRGLAADPRRQGRLERSCAVAALLSGLLWSAPILALPTPLALGSLLPLCMLLLAGVVTATGMLSPSRPAYYCFLLAALGPLVGRLLWDAPASLPLAPWGVVLFGLLLLAVHAFFHLMMLRMLEQRLQSEAIAREQKVILDTASEAILLVKEGRIVKSNPGASELLGCEAGVEIGSSLRAWHGDPEAWERQVHDCSHTLARGQRFRYATQLKRMNGTLFWAELSARAVDPSDLSLGTVWLGSNITARMEAEARLRASEERFRRLVSMSSDWYWEQDAELRFTRLHGAHIERARLAEARLLGKRLWELPEIVGVSAEQWERHRRQVDARQPYTDFVYQLIDEQGDTRWMSVAGNPMFDEQGKFCGYHGIGSEITERVRGAERFRHLAYHDTLTGLPNRRLLSDRLEQAIIQGRRWNHRVVVMLLDLDDFKGINDTQGHSTGDSVLVEIAQRLRAAVRESDTVARLGGDEFVVLLPELEEARDAQVVAEKIIATVREPVHIGARAYRLGVSVGIAIFPDHGESTERLMQRADIAMYAAKREGGSGYRFANEPDQPLLPLEFLG